METVHVAEEFLLAAVSLEMKKANEASSELTRLMSIGHLYSQMGLDAAKDVRNRLTKAYELLANVNIPGSKLTQMNILHTISEQDRIIKTIEFHL